MISPSPFQPGLEPYPGYRLLKRRGGRNGPEVWEAETTDGLRVALKFLPCDDSGTAARKIQSLRTLHELEHPHLLHIAAEWSPSGFLVVMMPRGQSLAELLDASPTPFGPPSLAPDRVCCYLAQAADVLDFLNTRQHQLAGQCVGFQHGGVKPSNLLLFGEMVKLTDFGLTSPNSVLLSWEDRAEAFPYTAPEVFQGQLSDRTDQYSLAATYCQLRGGRLPFPVPSPALLQEPVRAPPDLTMLAEEERPIIARALLPAPHERWSSCRELLARLQECGQHRSPYPGTKVRTI
jgi:serine/threonine protein kinase